MPLSEREEQQFRRIASQLSTDDPRLSERMGKLSERLSGVGVLTIWALVVLGGLALLPLAAETRLYPLGGVGYVVACIAAMRGARASRYGTWFPKPARAAASGKAPSDIRAARWWKVTLGGLATLALLLTFTGPPGGSSPKGVQATVAETSGSGTAPATWGLTTRATG
jgi:hypothetical protein